MNPQCFPARPWPLILIFIAFLLFFFKENLRSQPTGFSDNLYLGGWDEAAGFTWDANGRMYVWERKGKVWVVENGVKQNSPLLNISDEVGGWRDFGLLGFALDPNFLSNGYIYLLYVVDRHHLLKFGTGQYNANTNEYFAATIGRITRYQVNISNYNSIVPNSRFVLLGNSLNDGPPILHESHGTGSLVFGQDGTLLATMGDGASYNAVDQGSDPETYWQQALNDGIITSAQNVGAYRCQMLSSYSGKILRLDPQTGNGVSSNPYYNAAQPKSAASRIWARGLRNPYRMCYVPETGSHNPADSDPGVFLLGDVGWSTREELDVVRGPEMNFGWPKYEGMTYQPGYNNSTYTPQIHSQPKMDWRTGTARGLVNGNIVNVGSSTLPGNSFIGNASTGGVWYHGHEMPTTWHDTYFHADYGAGWIKNIRFDANYNPLEVRNFIDVAGACVFLNTHPTEGGLWYVRWPDQIRKVTFTGTTTHAPVVFATADVTNGNSPLAVNFSSFNTYDQDGGALSYLWNFGDGTTSTQPNPSHTFTSGASAAGFNVTLTVTDNTNLTGTATLNISTNNSPPQIVSTSVNGINTFNPSITTNLSLSATVTDANHSAGQLSYLWEVLLYHNEHNHPVQSFTSATANVNITPVECYNASYWYRVKLKVSDPTGASDFYQKDIYPACSGTSQNISFSSIPDKLVGNAPFTISATATSGLPITFYVTEGPASVLGNTVTLQGVPGKVTIAATQPGNGTYAPAFNVERSFWVNVAPPSSCSGTGTISFEKWTGITGTAISQIPLTNTPNQTGSLTIFEIPVNALDNYGTRVRGYVCPPVTGQYRFWIASDDNGELWLSTSSNPANKQLIASVGSWTNSQEWTKFASQQSALITLTAGQQYYIEALMKEGTGGDNLAVGWQLPGGTLERPIPGMRLLPFSSQPPQSQTITFPAIADKLTNAAPFTISATASSGLPVSFQIVSGPATISGNTITLNGQVGTVTVRAMQAGIPPSGGQGGWAAAMPVDRTFNVTQGGGGGNIDLALSVTSNPANLAIYNNMSFTFTLTNSGTAAATNVRVFLPQPATVVWQGGNEYQVSQGIYDHFGAKVWFVGTVPAGGNATITVNWYVLATDPLTGWAEVSAADQTDTDSTPANGTPGTANEDDEAAKTVTVPGQGPQNQTINFPIISNKETTSPPFTVSATATSGLPVSFQIVSGPASIAGNTITLTGTTGVVSVRATQAGNALWNPAAPVDQLFLVNVPGLQDQTISFGTLPNKLTTDLPFSLSATASSSLPVSFSVQSGPATISGNTVTLTGQPGSVTIRASQGGNGSYNPAPNVDRTFQVTTPGGGGGVDLELTMNASPATITQWGNIGFTATLKNMGTVTATGVKVAFPKPSSVVFVGGNEVTVSKGSYGLFTDQIWTVGSMAPGSTETITVNWFILQNAPLTGYAQVTAATPADDDSTPNNGTSPTPNEDDEAAFTANAPGAGPQDQTITFPAISNKTTTSPPFTVSATATSGLPVSFSIVSGPAIISGNTITLGGTTGSVTVRATQTGNANWNAAPAVERTFVVSAPGLLDQTITFPTIPNKLTTDAPFNISATASSSLPVSFSLVSGPATLNGSQVTLTGATGTVTIRASQAGNAQYNPAPDVLRSFGVAQPGSGNGPDLEVTLTSSSPNLLIWNNVTFTVTVTNNGGQAASGVKLAVPIPQGLAHTANTPASGTSYDLFTQEWTVGSLPAGQAKTFTIVLFCLQNTTPLPYFVQVKTATPADVDSTPNNNTSGTPAEDDEALVTLMPPINPLIGAPGTGEAFKLNVAQDGATAKLRWTTNSGEHCLRYIVERSADGWQWDMILARDNEEFSDDFATYRDQDSHPLPGWNFYRVKQLRDDGNFAFSNVQMLEFWEDLDEFKLFPNPAGDYVDVNLRSVEGRIVRLLLVDRLGRLAKEVEIESAPIEPYRLDLSDVPEGWYVVWVQAEGRRAKGLRLVVGRF
ncbi:MAG: PQQ-dependent sugar dehydrogenase [Saprospiraceae bacterium]